MRNSGNKLFNATVNRQLAAKAKKHIRAAQTGFTKGRQFLKNVVKLDYVAAAQAVGCSTKRILMTEIMPNVVNNLIVIATLEMAHAIILEAALSFLGLGVQPPLPSWGLMVSEGKDMMLFEPWLITIPGVALFLLVLAINLMGDGVRDITAPENRN